MEDKVQQLILDDIKELKADVKQLLQFKWQIIGGSLVVSTFVTIALQILFTIVGRS